MSTAPVSAASVPGPVIENTMIAAPVVLSKYVIGADLASGKDRTATYRVRLCLGCELPLTSKRLKAVPNATMCAPCLEAGGDVDKIKSLDGDVELSSLYTKSDSYIERHLNRLRHALVNTPRVAGDDAHLDTVMQPIAGYRAADAFEDSMIQCIDLKKERGEK